MLQLTSNQMACSDRLFSGNCILLVLLQANKCITQTATIYATSATLIFQKQENFLRILIFADDTDREIPQKLDDVKISHFTVNITHTM